MFWTYELNPFRITSLVRATRQPLDWVSEMRRTVRDIADKSGMQLAIWASGGIDSEVIIRSCVEAGIRPLMLTLKYDNDVNAHEICYAYELSKDLGLKHEIIDIDFDNFVYNVIPDSINSGYGSARFWPNIQKYMADWSKTMNYVTLAGGGETRISYGKSKNKGQGYLGYHYNTIMIPIIEYCNRESIKNFIPFFYFHSPELMLSWLNIPFIKSALDFPRIVAEKSNQNHFKCVVKYGHYRMKERYKFIGIEPYYDAITSRALRLEKEKGIIYQSDFVTIDELISGLSPRGLHWLS